MVCSETPKIRVTFLPGHATTEGGQYLHSEVFRVRFHAGSLAFRSTPTQAAASGLQYGCSKVRPRVTSGPIYLSPANPEIHLQIEEKSGEGGIRTLETA